MNRLRILALACLAAAGLCAAGGAMEAPERIAGGPLMEAAQCGRCHGGQFRRWSSSRHAAHEIQCYECHGGFHSGTLRGCKRCHQAAHAKRFEHWPEVTRFEDPSGTDFMCIVCHEPHVGSLTRALRDGCYPCHGNMAHSAMADVIHRHFASAISPLSMDQFAREHEGIGPWIASLSGPQSAAVRAGMVVGAYALCFVMLLPFGYFGASVVSGLRRRRRGEEQPASRANGRQAAPSGGGPPPQ